VLGALTRLRTLYGAVWAECVWQIIDATPSPTKFIISDHPVTVYNQACAPGNPLHSRGADDPDIRLHATQTLFPLSPHRLLVLTNRSWACNPSRPPTQMRANPSLHRGAIFNFMEIHKGRVLSEAEVLAINRVIKLRSYRFIAAGREEWLYPECRSKLPWRKVGESALLMPDPRPLTPGSEMILSYAGGGIEAMDSYGRLPGAPGYTQEMASEEEWGPLQRWQDEFAERFGPDLRGGPWDEMRGKGGPGSRW
jgi:Protein of unknown function (DUF4238)